MQYSFVVPIYNDGFLAEAFCLEFDKAFQSILGQISIAEGVELIFVNDGSSNDSLRFLTELHKQFAFVKVVDLSRNFGQHIALTAGYQHASGDFVGMMNVDMEDPPSEIIKLIESMKAGKFDIVTSLRTTRNASLLDRLTSTFFHSLLNRLTGAEVPINCSTLRLMNRRFVDAYNRLSEKERYIPGLEYWLGFRHGYVETVQRERKAGKSSYNFLKRLRFAARAILSFSSLPLKLTVTIGLSIALLGFALSIWLIFSKLFLVNYQPGYTSTLSLLMFFGGTQIGVTGVVGLYVGKILTEVQNRPLFLVREKWGL